ncbi:MAG: A/G-specific adenine glycosylase [Opitutaceae bacterium]
MALNFDSNPRELIDKFRLHLHRWYRKEHRRLPWRNRPDVYQTVVSEFMCQQTQITTVLPYFERWMISFPDFATLARASEEEVLKHWEGLGYYRRARYLHAVARKLNGMNPPRTAPEWAKLPGIGPYTAAAIASIAFGRAVACVDGNVVRILSRLAGVEQPFTNGGAAVKAFTPLADSLMDDDNPGTHNQAMMELGATVCLRKKPLCMLCPVQSFCRAGPGGYADRLPRIQRETTIKQEVDRVWIIRRGRLLLHRLPEESSRMARLHELPTAAEAGVAPTSLKQYPCKIRRRSITRYRITERIWFPPDNAKVTVPIKGTDACQWVPLDQVEAITLSGPHRRWVKEFLAERAAPTL